MINPHIEKLLEKVEKKRKQYRHIFHHSRFSRGHMSLYRFEYFEAISYISNILARL